MSEWSTANLGSLISLEYGAPLPEHARSGHGLPVVGSSGIVGHHAVASRRGPGIVVGRKGTVGALTWLDEDFSPIDTTYWVRPNKELNLRWLYLAMERLGLRRLDSSTGVPGLNRHDAYGLSVEVPPLSEQRRIAEILHALDLAIGTTERLIAKLVSASSGVVESRLGELAATSTVVSLASVADIGGGLALSSKRSVADPVTVPYLRVANVQDGFIDLSEVKSVTIDRRDLKRFELRTGDVLMNEGGDFDKLGRGAVWDGSIARCVHQNHVFRVRCDAGRLLPKYLAIYAASWRGKQYFTASSKQTTNLASINKAQLGKFPVPLVHVNQQRSFVVLIEQAEQRLKAEYAALRKVRSIRSGLAGDLLTGRIRTVPV